MHTLFTGRSRMHLRAVDSTNSYASELLRQNAIAEGFLVTAEQQTGGRGQRGTSWESEPGANALLSIVLYPKFIPAEKQFILSQAISLAIADVLAGEGCDPSQIRIKWPNDVFVGSRKVCGILIENTIRENQLVSSVCGIGVNVNQRSFASAPNAVSLATLTGRDHSVGSVIDSICGHVEARYMKLRAGNITGIQREYTEKLYRIGMWSQFSSAQGRFTARIEGTTDTGLLEVQFQTGEKMTFGLKEISLLSESN